MKTPSGRVADTLKKLRTKLRQREKIDENKKRRQLNMFGEEPNHDNIGSDDDSTTAIQNLDELGNKAVLSEILSAILQGTLATFSCSNVSNFVTNFSIDMKIYTFPSLICFCFQVPDFIQTSFRKHEKNILKCRRSLFLPTLPKLPNLPSTSKVFTYKSNKKCASKHMYKQRGKQQLSNTMSRKNSNTAELYNCLFPKNPSANIRHEKQFVIPYLSFYLAEKTLGIRDDFVSFMYYSVHSFKMTCQVLAAQIQLDSNINKKMRC